MQQANKKQQQELLNIDPVSSQILSQEGSTLGDSLRPNLQNLDQIMQKQNQYKQYNPQDQILLEAQQPHQLYLWIQSQINRLIQLLFTPVTLFLSIISLFIELGLIIVSVFGAPPQYYIRRNKVTSIEEKVNQKNANILKIKRQIKIINKEAQDIQQEKISLETQIHLLQQNPDETVGISEHYMKQFSQQHEEDIMRTEIPANIQYLNNLGQALVRTSYVSLVILLFTLFFYWNLFKDTLVSHSMFGFAIVGIWGLATYRNNYTKNAVYMRFMIMSTALMCLGVLFTFLIGVNKREPATYKSNLKYLAQSINTEATKL